MIKKVSIPKYPDDNYTNEDAVDGNAEFLVVSDGAGGGGVYADKWAQYLVGNLPAMPITTFEELDAWVDGIWEEFYYKYEQEAKSVGGLLLEKFYDEGSFAILAALWHGKPDLCQWMTYGDSVVFHYNKRTKELQHSFGKLVDFNLPPYLINYNEPLKQGGFRCGRFEVDKDSIVFITSDALAHYVIMMYEVSKRDVFCKELEEAVNAHSKNSNAVNMALSLEPFDFGKKVVEKLIRCVNNKRNFRHHTEELKSKGLLMEDDYSMVFSKDTYLSSY